jgi:hypothetical protein
MRCNSLHNQSELLCSCFPTPLNILVLSLYSLDMYCLQKTHELIQQCRGRILISDWIMKALTSSVDYPIDEFTAE